MNVNLDLPISESEVKKILKDRKELDLTTDVAPEWANVIEQEAPELAHKIKDINDGNE